MAFQSTHPLRGATRNEDAVVFVLLISIHAPLAGCDVALLGQIAAVVISIHAPLAGCDASQSPRQTRRSNFNPRTPCGVRRGSPSLLSRSAVFQSTHPLRGATSFSLSMLHLTSLISIHAPLAGCDTETVIAFLGRYDFNPRTPCGVRQQKYTKNLLHFCNNRQ